ncbi:MAG: S-adenosylmethionine:tRNA ribosyltransferase-isomerase [Oscillospiraceae bacterium]|nr:S-adenosylmethionine:tRNA ribosyltransferase-isomerase [Oscillospiraceae bacterium]
MKLLEFDFDLPKELIAQVPIEKRDESRLLVLNRQNKAIEHRKFNNILDYLRKGDCLVINNTKVIPARLLGNKVENIIECHSEPFFGDNSTKNLLKSLDSSGVNLCSNTQNDDVKTHSIVEVLLLKRIENDKWETMVRPGKKLKTGAEIEFGEGILKAKILEILENGNRIVEFYYKGIFNEILDKIGLMPLPPYIKETLKEKDRYQTVYAEHEGSSAAPTAGLHFTKEIMEKIKELGVEIANVTLHVGIGTFRPVKVENIEEHEMHSEHFIIKKEDAEKINNAKNNGNRVIAVGTTSCRVLETVAGSRNVGAPAHRYPGSTTNVGASAHRYPGCTTNVGAPAHRYPGCTTNVGANIVRPRPCGCRRPKLRGSTGLCMRRRYRYFYISWLQI